ncbi:MAG: DsbA family protein [Bacteroidota bacterium]
MDNQICDPVTGFCTPAALTSLIENTLDTNQNPLEIVYIGDPMCSWCWGIAEELKALREHYVAEGNTFKIVVGGLRPGGGDQWNDQFKNFLKHHWKEVNQRSGQPFGNKLFDLEQFNYDTEPACRAVVAARPFVGEKELAFFEAVQRRFYVENEDPKEVDFYKPICEKFDIDFDAFSKAFLDQASIKATQDEFVLNRSWGVRGYPSVVVKTKDQMHLIANGYSTFEQMRGRVEAIREEVVTN